MKKKKKKRKVVARASQWTEHPGPKVSKQNFVER